MLALPYPSQGHINPMLHFSKRLASKGLKATFATTHFIYKSMQPESSGSVQFDTISDGYDDGGFYQSESIHAYLTRLEAIGSKTLADLIIKHKDLGHPIDCIIYDAFLPWALDVAKQFGLVSVVFFTQACAVNFIYYYVHHGLLKLPVSSTVPVSIPGMPLLELQDMPSFIYVSGSYPAYFEMLLRQFSNTDKADLIVVNTFYKLEAEVGYTIKYFQCYMTLCLEGRERWMNSNHLSLSSLPSIFFFLMISRGGRFKLPKFSFMGELVLLTFPY